eukprot:m51a1_g682 hypothetical protein (222) ;mRNA; f:313425-314458
MKFRYLTPEALAKIRTDPGRYKMEDNSTLSRLLQPWWTAVASAMPEWVSANAITVGAVVPLALCYLASMVVPYSGGLCPAPLQFLCAASVLVFQTLDAVDGKHARRLGTASPLGDFLDHVVDCVCIMLIAVTIISCVGMSELARLLTINAAALNFLAVHWESSKLFVMTMDDGTSITEAQVAFAAVFLVVPLAGAWVWTASPIPFVPFSFGNIAYMPWGSW